MSQKMLVIATFALGTSGICAYDSNAATEDSHIAQPAPVRDGSHDFDFIYGKWRMPNHRLKKRLAGSHEWVDFVTCDEGSALPGGIGDIDYWKAGLWKDFVGVTLRTYDPKTGLWRIYWVDNTFSGGVIQPPVVGKFEGNVGIFEGPDTFNGIPVKVRYTWTVDPKGVPAAAKWEKALTLQALPLWRSGSKRSRRTAGRPGKRTGTTNSSTTIIACPRHDRTSQATEKESWDEKASGAGAMRRASRCRPETSYHNPAVGRARPQ